MNPSTIRTFFACEISVEILAQIDRLLADLRTRLPRQVKWVSVKNMHLTIQFLGEFRKTDAPLIQGSLQNALVSLKPFDLHIQKMGAFPSPAKAKVIWLGIDPQPRLMELVEIVNRETKKFGYPGEERPFSAHITLGRVKPSTTPDDLAAIKNVILSCKDIDIDIQRVERLYFIKSELTPSGPHYQELFNLPLSA